MNELLLVRHAETDLAGTFCGHCDPPVNARGYEQIADLLDRLRSETIDAVYTSDLQRARTTAEALAGYFGVPCISMGGLREINFGAWEGLTWDQIEATHPEYAARWLELYPQLAAPDGERFDAFEARVHAALDTLLHHREHRQIVIVTHAGVLRSILQTRCGFTQEEAWSRTKKYAAVFRYAPALRLTIDETFASASLAMAGEEHS